MTAAASDGARRDRPAVLVATEIGGARGAEALAAAIAVSAATGRGSRYRPALVVELGDERRKRGPTLLAADDARELELSLGDVDAAARGHICHLGMGAEAESLDRLHALSAASEVGLLVAHLPATMWIEATERSELPVSGGLIRAELPADRSMAALAVDRLRARGRRARVLSRPLGRLAARRALAGVEPGGEASSRVARVARGLLGGESGQALPAAMAVACVLLFAAVALVAIGGAVTGKGRVQRAADLAALSGARSLRDDLPRLLAPVVLPGGIPNPRHLSKAPYLARARLAARDAGRHNEVAAARMRVEFPDVASPAPVQVRVRVLARIDPESLPVSTAGESRPEPIPVTASAVAEASPPAGSWTGEPATASGGGYSGPLTYRNGEGMRPDVGRAFDRMAAAAARAGHHLVVTSGFRSDAEQAELFARHPDPRWVAPPGRSLHRCATELDLGPSSAHGWLAANARRFGFLKRYSWEPWHFGYVAGPPPCSSTGTSTSGNGADGGEAGSSLPSFVPSRYRPPILRSAAKWNVSPALIAAQIYAESSFNPRAVSPAGAQGIAQFMPGTARSYGLRNPFDPVAAIDAQAHLMSDLLRRFRSIPLALAAYNAGPGAVAACHCVPGYPETRAYVARILGILDGSGAILTPALEVRLIE